MTSNLIAAAILLDGAAAATPPIRPAQLWETTLPERIAAVALSPDCLAVLTASRLVVFDTNGGRMWEETLPEPAKDEQQGLVAIAPSCEWAAAAIGVYSPYVQIVRRDHTRTAIPVNDAEHPNVDLARWAGPMSLSISPNSQLLAVGTAWKDNLFLIDRSGAVTKRRPITDLGEPIVAEFSSSGQQLVVTGVWTIGILNLDGTFKWRRDGDFSYMQPANGASSFVARYTPNHGPQFGFVSLLNQIGRERWRREAWSASMAIAPNGKFVAIAGVPMNQSEWKEAERQVWIVSPGNRTLVRRRLRAQVVTVSSDNRCVMLQERDPANAHGNPDSMDDLVGRDRRLNQTWRIAGAYNGASVVIGPTMVLQSDKARLRAFSMPSCAP